jgi:hypothetical protein
MTPARAFNQLLHLPFIRGIEELANGLEIRAFDGLGGLGEEKCRRKQVEKKCNHTQTQRVMRCA